MVTTKLSWQQEIDLLKANGYKWRFAGIVGTKKQFDLYAPTGERVTREEALARIHEEKDAREWAAIEASMIDLAWHGFFSEAVVMHSHIVAMHGEGDSYVIFPDGTKVDEIAYQQRDDRRSASGKLIRARYTLPDGAVFLFEDNLLQTPEETEQGKAFARGQ